jgi:spore coat polysaccharide biosynthesis protein SpsF
MRAATIRAFVQARMSSRRFPGKVLAPLGGEPIISRIVSTIAEIIPLDQITVATSLEKSDDPLAEYVGELGVSVHRGSLENVFERFRTCLDKYPCDWFFRICADSPLLDNQMFGRLSEHVDAGPDLISNVMIRTFPKGRSLELVNARTFAGIDAARLTYEEKEHLTKFFYNHPTEFRIINIDSGKPELAELSYAVDTVDDLHRLERALLSGDLRAARAGESPRQTA